MHAYKNDTQVYYCAASKRWSKYTTNVGLLQGFDEESIKVELIIAKSCVNESIKFKKKIETPFVIGPVSHFVTKMSS